MDHIRSLIPKVLNKRGLKKHADAAMICWKTDEWIAKHLPQAADSLKAKRFDDGELTVKAQNSIAGQECQQVSADLLTYLQAECPEIPSIRLRISR